MKPNCLLCRSRPNNLHTFNITKGSQSLKRNRHRCYSRWLLSLFLFLWPFYIGNITCWSEEYIWYAQGGHVAADVDSARDEKYVFSPPGPIHVIARVDAKATDCGGGWSKAEVDIGLVDSEARVWESTKPDCSGYGPTASSISQWAGSFDSEKPEPILFEFKMTPIKLNSYSTGYIFYDYDLDPTFQYIQNITGKSIPGKNGSWHKRPEIAPAKYSATLGAFLFEVNSDPYSYESRLNISVKAHKVGGCMDFDEPVQCGVQIKYCNYDGGVRIKRSKNDKEEFIAGCYYGPGRNEYSQLKDGRFRWINMEVIEIDGEVTIRTVDVYTYNPCLDIVEKRRYPSLQDFETNRNSQTGELVGGSSWIGPPQQGSEDLNEVSLQINIVPPLRKLGGENMFFKEFSPAAGLSCMSTDRTKWSYGLVVSEQLGAVVSPGDVLILEGSGIISGAVEGNAATGGFGAWRVKEISPGRVIFEATVAATIYGIIDTFVVNGGLNTVTGELNYKSMGNWIGRTDKVAGPISKGLPYLPLLLDD